MNESGTTSKNQETENGRATERNSHINKSRKRERTIKREIREETDLIELPPARELDYARGEPSEIGAREGFRWHRRGLREAARGRIGGGGGGGERGAGRKEGSRWGIRGPRSDLKEGRRRSAKGKADAVHRCGAKALLLLVG